MYFSRPPVEFKINPAVEVAEHAYFQKRDSSIPVSSATRQNFNGGSNSGHGDINAAANASGANYTKKLGG